MGMLTNYRANNFKHVVSIVGTFHFLAFAFAGLRLRLSSLRVVCVENGEHGFKPRRYY